ncbi:hypothetical protein SORBI_3008G180400 [Sorghum bicolor]|uniref:CCHC-type domain-containing protein n=1 Tax=Sorghum bicolor TaxID=4558 RepID=A0A1Z5R8C1_SORBI|nr:hypothetical protein SORBI_3008G180400 [Sorghum bicolor]
MNTHLYFCVTEHVFMFRPIILENDEVASNKPVTESMQKSGAFTGTDDEEITAIRTVINAAEIKWGGSLSGGGYDGGQLGHHCGRPMEGEAPPPDYVCRVCCIPGHFIWQCPTGSKPPPPGYICHKCGVPGHFIHSCPNEIRVKSCSRKKNSCPNYGNRKYDCRRTSSLIPIVSSFDDVILAELAQDMSSSVADSLPAELHCPLCKKVMIDAMLSSKCCYDSFCDKCIRDYIITQSKCLCGVEILADDLIPNPTLRITISSLLSSRAGGLSSGTGNLASSNSSNLDGNSVTASAVLKWDTKQQMDSAPSATTEGSCLVTACKNPVEKSTHSDLQSKTEETEKTSVKKTKAAAGATETFPEPRCQKQLEPDGVAIVSGKLEQKVVRTKQKKAGATGNVNTNCAEYGFNSPFEPPCYDSLFGLGGQPWGANPYMYYMNMPSFSYPLGPYNVNDISNLPLHGPGLQGYPAVPAIHYSNEFQPRDLQDTEASAHARQSKRSKGAGPRSHKPERYRPHTSTQKGGSKRGGRSFQETTTLDSSIESDDYEEIHGQKKVGAHPTTSPRDGGQRRHDQDSSISELPDNNEEPHGREEARARSRSPRSSSRHSYKRHAYEGSTTSSADDADEEINFKRRW